MRKPRGWSRFFLSFLVVLLSPGPSDHSPQLNLGANFSFLIGNKLAEGNTGGGLCDPLDIKLNFNIVRVSIRPKGLCPFCCQLKLKSDIRFFLYTKNNPDNGKILPKLKAGGAARAGLRPGSPTIVYIHGFLEQSPTGASGTTIRKAYMSRPEWYNVIIVDWSSLSAGPWYLEAVRNTRVVAKVLAETLRTYHVSGEIPLETVHLVGFSLGAHVAGFTGKYLKELVVPRITGLDPAFPLFPVEDTSNRLSNLDAKFVDVIHTSRRTLGFPISIGHADFYPNFGQFYQPGCGMDELVMQNKIEDLFSCSHQRSWIYFAESVNNPSAFSSLQCQLFGDALLSCSKYSSAIMGFNVSKLTRGDYYVSTNSNSPYGFVVEKQPSIFGKR